jgi:prephenate dehydrogenase
MNIVVIDGQSGRMGQLFIERTRAAGICDPITAIGTNAIATASMLKAGASMGATGENPVIVAARTADIIVGPIGILAADSMLGEVTPAMATAVGQSSAIKLLLPVNLCHNIVVGTQDLSLSAVLDEAVATLQRLLTK